MVNVIVASVNKTVLSLSPVEEAVPLQDNVFNSFSFELLIGTGAAPNVTRADLPLILPT